MYLMRCPGCAAHNQTERDHVTDVLTKVLSGQIHLNLMPSRCAGQMEAVLIVYNTPPVHELLPYRHISQPLSRIMHSHAPKLDPIGSSVARSLPNP